MKTRIAMNWRRPVLALGGLLLIGSLTGCVSQSRHDALAENYREMTDVALRAEAVALSNMHAKAELRDDLAAVQDDLASLRAAYGESASERAEMADRIEYLEALEAEMQATMSLYEDFVNQFEEAISLGVMSVEVRDGRLAIVMPNEVLFDSGEAELNDEGISTMQHVASVIASVPEHDFQVEGHTDNVPIRGGEFRDNWDLSTARATEVVSILIEDGVAPNQLSAAGYGETEPRQSNESDAGRAANRRVELVLVPDLSFLPETEVASNRTR